jgi:hypothetical protein
VVLTGIVQFSIPKPATFIPGSTIYYSVSFTCPSRPRLLDLLDAKVTLLRTETIILHERRNSKDTTIFVGKVQAEEVRVAMGAPGLEGGTKVLRGIISAGHEGVDLSWKLDGAVEVKVSALLNFHWGGVILGDYIVCSVLTKSPLYCSMH